MSSFPIALWLALGCRCFAAQELRLAHGASREHAYQIGAEQFATLVEKKTAGKLHVAISPDGRLASEGAAAEAVRLGNADIAILSADMMSYWVPIIQLLSMPYLFRDRLHAYRTVDGEIGEMLNREMEKVGFVNLAYLDIGVRQLANNYRPIRTPQDIINIPIQVMTNNTDASLLESWGAKPVPILFERLSDAFEQGLIVGMEGPLSTLRLAGHYQMLKHISLTEHSYMFAIVVMDKYRFERLDSSTREILRNAARQASLRERNYLRKQELEALAFLSRHGTIITRPDIKSFREASQIVYRDISNEVPSYWVDKVQNEK